MKLIKRGLKTQSLLQPRRLEAAFWAFREEQRYPPHVLLSKIKLIGTRKNSEMPNSNLMVEDSISGIQRIPVTGLRNSHKQKEKGFPLIRFHGEGKNEKKLNLGPGGAVGFGCGVGIGVGLVGGIGVGAWPWNCLKVVFGLGAGCGVGIGYGFGQGIGILWDRPPLKKSNGKRIVIEI